MEILMMNVFAVMSKKPLILRHLCTFLLVTVKLRYAETRSCFTMIKITTN